MDARALGWRLAPPWAPPGRLWLAWSGAQGDTLVRQDCLGLAAFLSDVCPVTLLARPEDLADCSLSAPPGVAAMAAPVPEGGIHAAAPLFLLDDGDRVTAAVHGGHPLAQVMLQSAVLALAEAVEGFSPDRVSTDGEGTLLAAEGLAAAWGGVAEAEAILADLLGTDTVVWVPGDDLACARFLAPGLVVVNAGAAATRRAILDRTDRAGRSLTVLTLPRPHHHGGCYGDCLMLGPLVVVPAYEDGADREARELVVAALPGRKVTSFAATLLAPPGAGLGATTAVMPGGNNPDTGK